MRSDPALLIANVAALSRAAKGLGVATVLTTGGARLGNAPGDRSDAGSAPQDEKETTMASNEEIIRNLYAVAEKEPKRFRFDCYYAGTIMLAQLGVLGNLEASLKK